MTDPKVEDGSGQAADDAADEAPEADAGDAAADAPDDAAADAAAAAPPGKEADAAAEAGTGDEGDEGDEATDAGDDAPAEEKDRLKALQDDIDDLRKRVADPLDQGDRSFIEEGEADEDEPVDDTIAPPG
ncbi:MAG: hypothetical protein ACR2MO_10605 [Acidimicrobiales bacterium]